LTEPAQKQPEASAKSSFSFQKLWKFFASLKLAIILILVLVGLSLIGTFIIQVPAEYAADPQGYLWWLENIAQAQTGAWYPLLRLLGFFNLFHSIWFVAAGLMLVINIFVCSLSRLKQVSTRLSLKPIILEPGYYKDVQTSQIMPGFKSINSVLSFLNKRGYQTAVTKSGSETHLIALKNRYSPLGTYLVHISLILFITGFVVGHYWGFQNSSFVVAEGQTKAVGYDTGLWLKLEAFQDEYYPDGTPKDFSSRVILLENQKEVKSGQVQVNHPLKYQGVRFFQSYFGPSEMIQIKQNGVIIYEGQVALDNNMNNHPYNRPAGLLQLPGQGYSIYFVAPATNMPDPALQSDQLGIEVYGRDNPQALAATVITRSMPLITGDLEITFGGSGHFSGFLVNSDPGSGFIWTAAAFLLLGLVMVFYFPRRQLRAALLENSSNGLDLYLRWDNSAANSGDSGRLAELLKKEISINSSDENKKEN
jgi:cytochrome c biogenesis protein